MIPLLFEISDKVVPVTAIYGVFGSLGMIGMLLGYWRWKLGMLWLFIPQLVVTYAFVSLQVEEVTYLYRHIIRELGEIYIWHNWFGPATGAGLTILGIVGGFCRSRRLNVS